MLSPDCLLKLISLKKTKLQVIVKTELFFVVVVFFSFHYSNFIRECRKLFDESTKVCEPKAACIFYSVHFLSTYKITKMFIKPTDLLLNLGYSFQSKIHLFTALETWERLEPVELAYSCIKDETKEENRAKSPIFLVHGILSNKKNWNGVNLLLASRTKRKVCAVDLRNHGDSPWNNRTDIEALAADIGYFLDKHGIKKVNLIGHSLGGKTCIHYALKNPDRVDSIVVEDIRPNTRSNTVSISQVISYMEFLTAAAESVPTGKTEDEAKQSIVNFLNKKLEEMGIKDRFLTKLSKSLEMKLVDGKWRFKHNLKVLAESLKNLDSFLTESTGLYSGPALFIYGTKSPYKVNEDKDNILKLFPSAELVPVEGADHIIHGVFRQFDDAVIRFLNKEY